MLEFHAEAPQATVTVSEGLAQGPYVALERESSGPNSRVPGGDRVAVRVGVVEMGRGNDQKGQGRRD